MTAQLRSPATPTSPQPSAAAPRSLVREAWRRIRMAIDETNYATERLMDLRAHR